MEDMFSTDFFAGNRARLREAVPEARLFVITANGLLQRNGDNTMPFRQDSNFWYLTGIDEPDIVLVMDGKEEYLIVPPRDAVRAAFDGALDYEALTARAGVAAVYEEEEGWKRLAAAAAKVEDVATLGTPPSYDERHGFYVNPARGRLLTRLRELREGLETTDLREYLMRLRIIKQPAELEALQAAIDVTIDGFKYVTAKPQLAKYEYEYQIEADLTQQFKRRGGSGHAYGAIVAGGKRACMLHNMANNAPVVKGELLLMDVGAEVSNYAADITRTVSIDGKATARQKAVFEAVLDVQEYAIGLLKPGVLLKEFEQEVEQYMGEKLRVLGLIKTAEHEHVRRFYPHATSHFLGLDVHDVGDYNLPLEPGMVLTCEPGIYIAEEAIGIRIEDDILITPEGNEVLSKRLPRTLA